MASLEKSHDAMQTARTRTSLISSRSGRARSQLRHRDQSFSNAAFNLLQPGGHIGIVLPDGNLNNPSLTWLRRWCEGKARILPWQPAGRDLPVGRRDR